MRRLALILCCAAFFGCSESLFAETTELKGQALNPNFKINDLIPSQETKASNPNRVDPKQRDAAFEKVKLSSDVANWDTVDKDVLFLRAKSLPSDRLCAHYPSIATTKLKKLQAQLRRKVDEK